MTKSSRGKNIEIIPPKIKKAIIEIEGTSPLICHPRTAEMIKKTPHPEKDEKIQFANSLYPKIGGKYTFPASAFKEALIAAAKTYCESIDKNKVRGIFFIKQEWLSLEGEPEPFKRLVKIPPRTGGVVEKTRAIFPTWKTKIAIEFDENGPLTFEQLINLAASAGYHVGFGAWRPELGGDHGQFRIASVKTVEK